MRARLLLAVLAIACFGLETELNRELEGLQKLIGDTAHVEPIAEGERLAAGHVSDWKLFANQPMKDGDDVATMTKDDLFQITDATTILPWLKDHSELTEVQKLMLGLMGGDTFYSGVEMRNPLLWSNAEVAELRETQIWADLRQTIQSLKTTYQQVVRKLVAEHALDRKVYSFRRWKWAYAVVMAHQFIGADSIVRLVPAIRLFSFARVGNAHLHELENGSLSIRLRKAVSEGDEVIVNEDISDSSPEEESNNARLLRLFGIVVSKRAFGFPTAVALDREDPMFGNKRELFDVRFGPKSTTVPSFQLSAASIPSNLIFALRIYHAETTEHHELRNALKNKMISSRNEKLTWESLGTLCYQRLEQFPTTIMEDKELLDEWKRDGNGSRNVKNALLFRRSEKRVLMNTLRHVDNQLRVLHENYMVRESDPIKMGKTGEGEPMFKVVDEL